MRADKPAPESRAARRADRRKSRTIRLSAWLAAALFAAVGLLFAPRALRVDQTVPPAAFETAGEVRAPDATPAPEETLARGDAAAPDATPAPEETLARGDAAAPDATPAPEEAPAPSLASPPATGPAAEPARVTISAAGDCTLGGDPGGRTAGAFARAYKGRGAEYFFKNVRDIFEADDATIVNLEGPLTKASRHKEKEFAFRGEPEYAKILALGGVEVANIANNHAKDYYDAGLRDTASALKKAGVGMCGWGKTTILEVKGVKIGFCGFAVWYNTKGDMQKKIAALKKRCDLVIASIHWGEEGEGRALKVQRDYGRAAVRAGANLVLGHHPHVVGAIERYGGATIVYSLGNFCFGGNVNPDDKDAFIFQQTFERSGGGYTASETLVIPCSISGSKSRNDYQPVPLEGDSARRVLARIAKLSKGFDEPADLTASYARIDAGNSGPAARAPQGG